VDPRNTDFSERRDQLSKRSGWRNLSTGLDMDQNAARLWTSSRLEICRTKKKQKEAKSDSENKVLTGSMMHRIRF